MKTKTDLYTKVILTVIAVFLGLNFIKGTDLDIITTAKAHNIAPIEAPAPLPTESAQRAVLDVNIVQMNGIPIYNRIITVNGGQNRTVLPISLEYVNAFNMYSVPVNLTEIRGSKVSVSPVPAYDSRYQSNEVLLGVASY